MDNRDIKKWKVNLNEYIMVKLNDKGKDIYYHQYDEVNENIKRHGGKPIIPKMPKVDEEGYTRFQMWQFMNLYGEYMTIGFDTVLETMDIIIDGGEPYVESDK